LASDIPGRIGLMMGDSGSEVGRLQSYLKRIGYIRGDEAVRFGAKIDLTRATAEPQRDVFDNTTQEALKRFQEFNKLPVTGNLDEQTAELMQRPRCGVPDFLVGSDVSDYVIIRRWRKTDFTCRFENFTADLSQNMIRSAFQAAFGAWSSVTSLTFREVTSVGDITKLWTTRGQGDEYFDRPGGLFGYAYYPQDGRVHLDDDENFTFTTPPTGMDLVTAVMHEVGHSLGLGHSSDTNAIMYSAPMTSRNLDPVDIMGIQSLC
jgi:peptidoglycan hydrolase-like protein with peptidoglycan-binding domain